MASEEAVGSPCWSHDILVLDYEIGHSRLSPPALNPELIDLLVGWPTSQTEPRRCHEDRYVDHHLDQD